MSSGRQSPGQHFGEALGTQSAMAGPFAEMTQHGIQTVAEWHKRLLDFTTDQGSKMTEAQKSVIDLALEQSNLMLDAVQRQSQAVADAFTDSLRRSVDAYVQMQRTFIETATEQTRTASQAAARAAGEASERAVGGMATMRRRGSEWEQIDARWNQYRARFRERWDKLSDGDLDGIRGNRDQLAGKIQELYGIPRDEAIRQLDDFARQIAAERQERVRTA
jgi:uncharacterized protein YjbJ (UPF0337 family)